MTDDAEDLTLEGELASIAGLDGPLFETNIAGAVFHRPKIDALVDAIWSKFARENAIEPDPQPELQFGPDPHEAGRTLVMLPGGDVIGWFHTRDALA